MVTEKIIKAIPVTAAREIRNYINVLKNMGCATDKYIEELTDLAAALSTDAEPVAWGNFKSDGTLVGLSEEKNENWTGAKPLYAAPFAPSMAVKHPLDSVWNAAVEQAAAIADDCVHLTPDPGAAIKAMLNGRANLYPTSEAALSAQVQDVATVSPAEYMRRHDAAIAAYEANTSDTSQYSAVALRKAVDAAFAVAAAPAAKLEEKP